MSHQWMKNGVNVNEILWAGSPFKQSRCLAASSDCSQQKPAGKWGRQFPTPLLADCNQHKPTGRWSRHFPMPYTSSDGLLLGLCDDASRCGP